MRDLNINDDVRIVSTGDLGKIVGINEHDIPQTYFIKLFCDNTIHLYSKCEVVSFD